MVAEDKENVPGSVGVAGKKRPRPPATVDDVVEWLETVCQGTDVTDACRRVRESEIDGEVLASLSEADIVNELGIAKFGLRRKIFKRIGETFGIASPVPMLGAPCGLQPSLSTAASISSGGFHPPAAAMAVATVQQQQGRVPAATPQAQVRQQQLHFGEPSGDPGPGPNRLGVATTGQKQQQTLQLQGGVLVVASPAVAAAPAPAATPAVAAPGRLGPSSAAQQRAQQGSHLPFTAQQQQQQQQGSPHPTWAGASSLVAVKGERRNQAMPEGVRIERRQDLPPQGLDCAAGGSGGGGSGGGGAAAAGAEEEEGAEPLVRSETDVEAQLAAEGACVGACQWVAQKLLQKLPQRGWAPDGLLASRLGELHDLAKRCVLPGMTIVVLGNTGAGKSSTLNALIGEHAVLPTNGMRACTAALIELGYDHSWQQGKPHYVGEIEFISQAEWDAEVAVLLDDLTQQDGRAVLNVSDPDHASYVSWCKLATVYGQQYRCSNEAYYIGGKKEYRPPLVADLLAKLRRDTRITRNLGKTITVTANCPREFRRKIEAYVDSSNEPASGRRPEDERVAHWPLVRMARMRSHKWGVLKTGATLVDAPGVQDDNSARDVVVKRFLKEADSIWIVSHISRAVNDKTAKDMLGEAFRRQLLMDGQYGQLMFIATQTDSILRSEVASNLGLPHDAPLEQCAAARNEFTKRRIQEDFLDGLEEMQRMSGGDGAVDREALRQRFTLPVFTTSSLDFQKLSGIRQHDGNAAVWTNVQGTEIPALRTFVYNTTLQRRRVNIRKQVERLVQFCEGLCSYLSGQDQGRAAAHALRSAYTQLAQGWLAGQLTSARGEYEEAVMQGLKADIGPQLRAGADAGMAEVMSTVRGFGSGMHWATYKATCRRHGVWRINMNEQMAEPVYRAVSTYWERAFLGDLRKAFQELKQKVEQLLGSFHDKYRAELEQVQQQQQGGDGSAQGPPPAALSESLRQLDSVKDVALRTSAAKSSAALDAALAESLKEQRDVNRLITPAIQEHMVPAYERGMLECGTGSSGRRRAIIEGHVGATRQQMFDLAIRPVLEGLETLRITMVTQVTAAVAAAPSELRLSYSTLWDERSEAQREVQARLEPVVRSIMLEARRARDALLRSQGEALPSYGGGGGNAEEGGGDDDDEVQDVTEQAAQQQQHSPQEVICID